MKTVLLAFFILAALPSFESSVLRITGAGSMEELDESVLERFRSLALHPVDINAAGRSRLLSCGLFTAFQTASLLDYRQRTGDILSLVELSLVDGFPPDFVEAVSPFIRIESQGPPGKRRSRRLRTDIMLRGSARAAGDTLMAYGGKVKLSLGETAELFWGTRTTYSDGTLRPGTVSAAVYGRRHLGKIVLGHFNARFGQGLALWSGFSLQPYGSVSSLRRSGTGFSSTSSFSPELCGAAADFDLGRWNVGAAYSFTGHLPVATVSYVGNTFAAGATVTSNAVSADWRIGLPNVSVFGEVAWKEHLQAVAGVMWMPAYGSKITALARYVDGIPEIIAGAGTSSLESVAAYSPRQFRAMARYSPSFAAGPVAVTPSLRLACRHTDSWRTEGRGELGLSMAGWMLHSRLDIVRCEGTSWLVNAEAGREGKKLKAYFRWTLFKVENWADRIYVYERDAPGSFNVPAYYGKGYALAFAASWKPVRQHSFHLRVSYIEYPWMTIDKPSKLEVKVQYQLSL